MQTEVNFTRDLKHFISMAIQIWPSFRSGLKHLSEIGQPQEGSYLPDKPYNQMEDEQFMLTIIQDLHEFILSHDVTVTDLEDYMFDILDLLMIEEDLIGGSSNPSSVQYMAQYLYDVIGQLQSSKKDKIDYFETNFYQKVKQFGIGIVEDKNNKSDSDDDCLSSQQQEISEPIKDKRKSSEQLNRQKQLEDDGWTIVKK